MNWRSICGRFGIDVTPEQAAAMDELESRGMTFCGNFGYKNAVEILADLKRDVESPTMEEWQSENGDSQRAGKLWNPNNLL